MDALIGLSSNNDFFVYFVDAMSVMCQVSVWLVVCALLGGSTAYVVNVAMDKVLHVVSEKFLSMTIDLSLLNSIPKFETFDFK